MGEGDLTRIGYIKALASKYGSDRALQAVAAIVLWVLICGFATVYCYSERQNLILGLEIPSFLTHEKDSFSFLRSILRVGPWELVVFGPAYILWVAFVNSKMANSSKAPVKPNPVQNSISLPEASPAPPKDAKQRGKGSWKDLWASVLFLSPLILPKFSFLPRADAFACFLISLLVFGFSYVKLHEAIDRFGGGKEQIGNIIVGAIFSLSGSLIAALLCAVSVYVTPGIVGRLDDDVCSKFHVVSTITNKNVSHIGWKIADMEGSLLMREKNTEGIYEVVQIFNSEIARVTHHATLSFEHEKRIGFPKCFH